MQTFQIERRYNNLFFILVCVLCMYIVARAYYVDITDDEAWSFYNVKKFWYVEALCTGNTHWFNFVAIKIALLLGLEKTWQLRWLSVLSGILFLYIGFIWIKSLKAFPLKLLAFSFSLLNSYLLEYLSLARGYSFGLCLMALSLLLLVMSNQKQSDKKFAFASFIIAGLSAVANFNFFYYFSAFCVVYFYLHYSKKEFSYLKDKRFYVAIFYALSITLLVFRALWFIRACSNDIGGFGGEGLIYSVFYNYMYLLTRHIFQFPTTLVSILAYLFFGIIILGALFGIIKFKKHANHVYFYASSILLIMLFLVIFNKWCFGVLYPIERTALMFYPLAALVVIGFLSKVKETRFIRISTYVVSLLLIVNFSLSVNLKSCRDYAYCANSKSYFAYLNKLKAKQVGLPLELYCVYVKYYQLTDYHFQVQSINTFGHEIKRIQKNKLDTFDYLLLFPPYNLHYYKQDRIKLEAVKLFPNTKVLLLKVLKL